jgi:hypothetical protein
MPFGRKDAVFWRSNIVGMPASLVRENATDYLPFHTRIHWLFVKWTFWWQLDVVWPVRGLDKTRCSCN